MNDISDLDLCRLRKWAEKKIAQGNEAPWAWYQYMKLVEAIGALEAGRVLPINRGGNRKDLQKHSAKRLRLVVSSEPEDRAH